MRPPLLASHAEPMFTVAPAEDVEFDEESTCDEALQTYVSEDFQRSTVDVHPVGGGTPSKLSSDWRANIATGYDHRSTVCETY